jgi:hypothetical protein
MTTQKICGVKDCERYRNDCPFGSKMVPKIDVDRPFKLNLNEWPDCFMPPVVPSDPDQGQRMAA